MTTFAHYHSNTPTQLTTDQSQLFQKSLLHKWFCNQSILCIIPSPKRRLLYCGTQNSSIIVLDLITFQKKTEFHAHQGSVLCLHLSSCEDQLFSAGSDSLVNIWDVSNIDDVNNSSIEIKLTHTIYSLLDIGDIFSLIWVENINTLFFGAQNATISYVCIDSIDKLQPLNHYHLMPSQRFDRFFDSKGPGRSNSPSSSHCDLSLLPKASNLIQVPSENIISYAHNGFVYSLDVLTDLDPQTSTLGDCIAERFQNILISGGGDGQIKLWGISKDSLHLEFLKSIENPDCVLSMTLNSQTMTLYAGLNGGEVKSWDLTTFQSLKNWQIDDDDAESTNNNNNNNNNNANDQNNNENHDVFAMTLSPSRDTLFMGTPMGITKRVLNNASMDLKLELPKVTTSNKFDSNLDGVYSRIGTPPPPPPSVIINGCVRITNNEPCLAMRTFEVDGDSYLVAAGSNKTVSLWSITTLNNSNQLNMSRSTSMTSPPPPFVNNNNSNFSNERFLQTLGDLISFRSVSQQPDLYQNDCRQCANYLMVLLRSLGAIKSELWPVENGNPIVNAIFKANAPNIDNNPPRVVWYAHYDVISASASTWTTPPFQLTPKNGYLYARGSTDNKGPLLAAIHAVGELHSKKQLKSDVIFIIEGEEESGSWGLSEALQNNKNKLGGDIDWILMSNSYWLDDEVPCLNYGLRGVIRAEIEVSSDSPDRHSGVHGGVVGEPSMDLIKVCSGLVENGEIQIDGFNQDFTNTLPNISTNSNLDLSNLDSNTVKLIMELRDWERPLYAEIAHRLPQFTIDDLIKKWREPALSLHRIEMSGPDNGTVIPQKAKAKISMRLVPGQDLQQVKQSLIDHIGTEFEKLNGANHLSVNIVHESEPWLGDVSNNAYTVLYDALEKEWGVPPIYIREGGSIPAMRYLERAFNCSAAHLPAGQSSDNAHLNDERIRVINLFKVRDVIKRVIQNVEKKA